MAILLAYSHPEVDLQAITTVAGNQTIDKTTLNARRVCALANIERVPIARGAPAPLVRTLQTADDIHGESGLDGTEWGDELAPLASRHAVELIVELVTSFPGEITLVPTGLLTNIALALKREPRIATLVKQMVLMGGSFTRGNTTPAAEFNILVDPEAAAAVFAAGWPITMIGLDVTHQALATPEIIQRIRALNTPLAATLVDILLFFGDAYLRKFGFEAPPVHDPCAVAWVIDPDLMACRDAFVAIETSGEWTTEMTVVDFQTLFGRRSNAQVAVSLDSERFWTMMIGALERLAGETSSH